MKQQLLIFLLCFQSVQANTLQFTYNKDFISHVLTSSFLRDMCTAFNRSIFVETGTYLGEATEVAAGLFSEVHSVELSHDLYKGSCQRLQHYPNIQLYHDHSVFFLDNFCSEFKKDADSMLFWLDAHYSWGVTTSYKDMLTTIVDELQIFDRYHMGDAVILVDDIRCFGSLYKNNDIAAHTGYPSAQKTVELLKKINPAYECILYGDTLVTYDANRYNPCVSALAQACTYSRLYDGDGDLSNTIIEQEALIAQANDDEAAMISLLYQRVLQQHDDFHAYLWYGLLIADVDADEALCAFQSVLDRGYTHWRIYWYMAQTAAAEANYDKARGYVHKVLEENPTYAPAVKLQQEIGEAARI